MDDEPCQLVRVAEDAYEAFRTINRLTVSIVYPAPTVYSVLGSLVRLGLPRAFTQLAESLGRSLDEFDVYEDAGLDPLQTVATATDHLTKAAQLAAAMCTELELARGAISSQGHH